MNTTVKRMLTALLCCTALLITGCGNNEMKNEIIEIENAEIPHDMTMANPHGVTEIGDPFILYDNGTYYMYATNGYGFRVWTSETPTDNSWKDAGYAYSVTETSFGSADFWAPEVYRYGEKYYIFYSAVNTTPAGVKHYAIGCAEADSPLGPFTDIIPGQPIYAPNYSVIDADVLFDKSGKCYLFYSRDISENAKGSWIYGIELSPDFKSTIGEPVLVASPEDEGWETCSGDRRWNEGPCVFERNGIYYLMYSANFYQDSSYSVGYAVSDSPLGSYTKYENNPVLKGLSGVASGTGHNNYFFSPDGSEMYCVYHTHTNGTNGWDRQLCIDKMMFDENGVLSINGPTNIRQPLPSGEDGMRNVKPGEYALSCGDAVNTVFGDPDYVTDGFWKQELTKKYWKFEPNGSPVRIDFTHPTAVGYIAVYGEPAGETCPDTVTVTVNGKYRISGIPFKNNDKPTLISFENLPEGVLAENIEFTFTFKTEGNNNSVSLREILITEKMNAENSAERE